MRLINIFKSYIKQLFKQLFGVEVTLKRPTLEEKILLECSQILPNLACIDIGASYYPHPAWEIFRHSVNTTWVACDPCQENLYYLEEWKWPCTVIKVPTGLSHKGKQQTLYITATDSGSSLLPPEIPVWKEHRMLREYFFPVRQRLIDTITLTDLIQTQGIGNNPFLIKLDTQGTELSILQSLDQNDVMQKLVAVEIEVTLQTEPVMQGSSHFYEVQKYFEDMGFELVCLKPIEGILPKFNSKLNGRSILNECDAVFVLRPDLALKKGIKCQLAIFGAYLAYKLYGEALHLILQLLERDDLDRNLQLHLNHLVYMLKA